MDEWRSKHVVITGGAGFIGSHLADAVLATGGEVTIFDRWHGPHLPDEATFAPGNVATWGPAALTSLFDGADIVFHLASLLGTEELLRKAHEAVQVNIVGTLNVLEAAVRTGSRVVFSSTPDVAWINPYKITKEAGEKFCLMYHREFGLDITVLRLTNIYGPRERWLEAPWDAPMNYQKAVSTFITKALAGLPLPIFGDGQQAAIYTHVSDVVRALMLAGSGPSTHATPIPIGMPGPISVLELAALVIQLTAWNGSGTPLEYLPMRRGETKTVLEIDPEPAERILGFKAEIPLRDGLEMTIPFYEQMIVAERRA